MRPYPLIGALLAAAALCACASKPPRVDADLGHSLQHMIRAQIYDPHAAQRAAAPSPADGERLEKVLQAHRADVGRASEQVAKPIHVNTGSN